MCVTPISVPSGHPDVRAHARSVFRIPNNRFDLRLRLFHFKARSVNLRDYRPIAGRKDAVAPDMEGNRVSIGRM